jgi:hypothetical protein
MSDVLDKEAETEKYKKLLLDSHQKMRDARKLADTLNINVAKLTFDVRDLNVKIDDAMNALLEFINMAAGVTYKVTLEERDLATFNIGLKDLTNASIKSAFKTVLDNPTIEKMSDVIAKKDLEEKEELKN